MSQASDYLENQIRMAILRTTAVTVRTISTGYALGARVMLGTSDLNVYEAVIAGTSSATTNASIVMNTALGSTTTDGGVTWLSCGVGMLKRPVYVSLHTATVNDDASGAEVSGGSYARAAWFPSDANWSAPDLTGGVSANVNDIVFSAPTANWGQVTHFALWDRLTAGNMLIWGALNPAKNVNSGDPAPRFPAQSLVITFA